MWRAQILLLCITPLPARIGEQRTVMDTNPRLVRFKIVALQKEEVVDCDHGHPPAARERDGCRDVSLFLWTPETLQLDIEAIVEQLEPLIERPVCLTFTRIYERAAYVTFRCAR